MTPLDYRKGSGGLEVGRNKKAHSNPLSGQSWTSIDWESFKNLRSGWSSRQVKSVSLKNGARLESLEN